MNNEIIERVENAKAEIERWVRQEEERVRREWAEWQHKLIDKVNKCKRSLYQWENNAWAAYVGRDYGINEIYVLPDLSCRLIADDKCPSADISSIPLLPEWYILDRVRADIHSFYESGMPGVMAHEIRIIHIIHSRDTGHNVGFIYEKFANDGDMNVVYNLEVEWDS